MSRSDRVAFGLGVAAAVVATLAGIVHTLDDRILHADRVADQAVRTLTVRTVLTSMTPPADNSVRDAFAAVGIAVPDRSVVRTRSALVASAADPATTDAVRRSIAEQHRALLAGRTPAELVLDTTPRRAPFIAGYGPEVQYRTILADHVDLAPTIRFAHGGWVDGVSVTMRIADTLAPVLDVLLAALVALLIATVLFAERRRVGLRRAGIALLVAAGALYLLFDGLIAIFFRATRSVEAEVAGRMYQGLVGAWSGYAAVIALAGAALVAGSLVLRRS
jgi:hypothetical protein